MSEYRFLTTWCLEAPIDPVWDAIHDSERWPQWWRGVERVVELEPADDGGGRWRLFQSDAATAVLYEWNVHTARAWMNRLAPIARPVFAWNHDYVMRNGAHGLARLLGARLLTAGGGVVPRSVASRRCVRPARRPTNLSAPRLDSRGST